MTVKSKKRLKISATLLSIILVFAIGYFIGIPLVRLAGTPEKIREWVNENAVLGRLGYIGMVIFQVVISILPGEPFEIAAGYVFGAIEGTLICLTAETIGSFLVFWLTKKFGIHIAEIFFSKEKIESAKFLKTNNKKNILFAILMTFPGTPKDLISYFAGLTDMPFGIWAIISFFGRIPSVATSTVGGNALFTGNYFTAALVFGVTVLISVFGIFLYNRYSKKSNEKGTKNTSNNK